MVADFKQSTSLYGKVLASSQIASASTETAVYTVPSASAVKVSTFSIANVTSSAVIVTISVVPSGSTADTTHRIMSGYTLAANDSTMIVEMQNAMMDAGAFISISASAANALNYLITGAVSS